MLLPSCLFGPKGQAWAAGGGHVASVSKYILVWTKDSMSESSLGVVHIQLPSYETVVWANYEVK